MATLYRFKDAQKIINYEDAQKSFRPFVDKNLSIKLEANGGTGVIPRMKPLSKEVYIYFDKWLKVNGLHKYENPDMLPNESKEQHLERLKTLGLYEEINPIVPKAEETEVPIVPEDTPEEIQLPVGAESIVPETEPEVIVPPVEAETIVPDPTPEVIQPLAGEIKIPSDLDQTEIKVDNSAPEVATEIKELIPSSPLVEPVQQEGEGKRIFNRRVGAYKKALAQQEQNLIENLEETK